MGKACEAFKMTDAAEAFTHIWNGRKVVKNYGHLCNDIPLYTWDDGERFLMMCETCGGYILVQNSEYHGLEKDSYYSDYFPVSGDEEAQKLNNRYNGYEIEEQFPGRYLICDYGKLPHWNRLL